MKRSQINTEIKEAMALFRQRGFCLPPFAGWIPEEWKAKGPEADEIRQAGLGWDLTDFGLGEYDKYGLLLFTVRNGWLGGPKPYAEKLMVVKPGQVTVMHFHFQKMEDIINRAGGRLLIRLYGATPEEGLSDQPLEASLDGVRRSCSPGEVVALSPGESITLPPRLYHEFWGEGEPVIVGEVSSVNDDRIDNRFLRPLGRFPKIEEDEPPFRLLCTEYPPAA